MEGLGKEIVSVFNNSTRPLPKPEEEENKFLGTLKHLSQKEARGVLKIIIDQARESRKYGLYLNSKLLKKEEGFFLTVLDVFGGISNIRNKYRFEDVKHTIAGMESNYFETESKEFYAKFSKKKGEVKNKYNAHLASVRSAVLNAVFNNQV